jgi:hypothetical protein
MVFRKHHTQECKMLSLLFVVPIGIGYALCMIYKIVPTAILRLARMEWIGEETLRVNIDYPLIPQLSIFLPCEGGNDVLVNSTSSPLESLLRMAILPTGTGTHRYRTGWTGYGHTSIPMDSIHTLPVKS